MPNASLPPRALLISAGGWHLPRTALAFEKRGALAGLWISDKNRTGVARGLYRRAWPFHLAMKPLYHLAPQIWTERALYAFTPVWKAWLSRQKYPDCNVVQAICGYGAEPFEWARRHGALTVLDCPNSHADSYHAIWQGECDRWCPGEKMPVPEWMLARMKREQEQADVLLCPSFFVRDSMIAGGIPGERCIVHPFGVDTSVFQPRKELPKKIRFVSVGTICLRKGYQYLFRAFERVKEALPDAELICVGEYKIDFRLERKRWEGSFTRFETLSHPDLAALLQTCSAFVLPSCEEGFARVIPEAMGAGLPIIATHESGASTLYRTGSEGILLVKVRDVDGLAEAMIKVAANPALNDTMGREARQRVAGSNTWQDYGDRLLEDYARLLAARSSR